MFSGSQGDIIQEITPQVDIGLLCLVNSHADLRLQVDIGLLCLACSCGDLRK